MVKRLPQLARLALFLVYAWNVGILAPAHQHLTDSTAACNHNASEHHHSHTCRHGHSHHDHDHSHDVHHEHQSPVVPAPSDHSHDCPVCQHLSLAAHFEQPSIELAPAGSVWLSPPLRIAVPFCEIYGIARSRAPPASA